MRIMIPPQANVNNIKVPADVILNTSKRKNPLVAGAPQTPLGSLYSPTGGDGASCLLPRISSRGFGVFCLELSISALRPTHLSVPSGAYSFLGSTP